MNRRASKAIETYFSARARAIMPRSARDHRQVLFVPVSGDPEITRQCSAVLCPEEQQRASRFAAPADNALFIQRRAFRRYCAALALESTQPLSAFQFVETADGRPYLADQPVLWFSFSSCRHGFLGAWSSTHDVGVDIEDNTRADGIAELAEQFFSSTEIPFVEAAKTPEGRQNFYRLWSLKESALKSIGRGLPFSLEAFVFELEPRPVAVRTPPEFGVPGRYNACVTQTADHCIASVVRSRH